MATRTTSKNRVSIWWKMVWAEGNSKLKRGNNAVWLLLTVYICHNQLRISFTNARRTGLYFDFCSASIICVMDAKSQQISAMHIFGRVASSRAAKFECKGMCCRLRPLLHPVYFVLMTVWICAESDIIVHQIYLESAHLLAWQTSIFADSCVQRKRLHADKWYKVNFVTKWFFCCFVVLCCAQNSRSCSLRSFLGQPYKTFTYGHR